MTVTDRRVSPRHRADWASTYRFDPRAPWRHCRVIDVAFDGAAIELDGTEEDEPLAGGLYVQVGSVVEDEPVGVELGNLRPDDRQLLQLQVSLRSFV